MSDDPDALTSILSGLQLRRGELQDAIGVGELIVVIVEPEVGLVPVHGIDRHDPQVGARDDDGVAAGLGLCLLRCGLADKGLPALADGVKHPLGAALLGPVAGEKIDGSRFAMRFSSTCLGRRDIALLTGFLRQGIP